ncbi:hypothetical protein AY599_19745 [Leptolyngbya valderiana BDU 20041]|nr:hypothetical protein AY599_19745 [Leptolyngbya valderiana BDU 20041]
MTSQSNADLTGRCVLIGVTGGIAAYKTATVVSRLSQRGCDVRVAMTEAATKFVTPLTFEALSGHPVVTGVWDHHDPGDVQHVNLADRVDLALIAPCTMDCLARLAHGHTSDPITLILSAVDRAKTPVLLSPSMNSVMLAQPSTQRNIAQLREDGYQILDAESGWQACRHVGPGRMPEPETLIEVVMEALVKL